MREILAALPAGARVLDLGCRTGSFDPPDGLHIVRLDVERPIVPGAAVQADAARLPFCGQAFDAVISNHSLEHFVEIALVLDEIRRVIKPVGALYVAVPDATTFTDRLYRWMARGGGHVNPFTTAGQVAELVEGRTGLRLRGCRTLYSSLSFLHWRSQPARTTRKLWLFLNGNETCLRVVGAGLRLSDRWLGTRLSVYGWALYFGAVEGIDPETWNNVCVGCGSGFPGEWLMREGRVRGGVLWRTFSCPACGSRSAFFGDELER